MDWLDRNLARVTFGLVAGALLVGLFVSASRAPEVQSPPEVDDGSTSVTMDFSLDLDVDGGVNIDFAPPPSVVIRTWRDRSGDVAAALRSGYNGCELVIPWRDGGVVTSVGCDVLRR